MKKQLESDISKIKLLRLMQIIKNNEKTIREMES